MLKSVLACRLAQANAAEKSARIEAKRAPGRELSGRGGANVIVETWDGDAAGFVMQRRQELRQHAQRIESRAAINPRMQIARRTSDGDLGESKPAQEGGDGGRLRVPLPGVADQRDVRLELIAMRRQEGSETRAAGLFLALDQHADIDRKLAMRLDPGSRRLDEGHQLAFVVGGAARDDDLAIARILDQARIERRRGPFIQRIRRLHVVMAVKQHMRARALGGRRAPMRDHHRLAQSGFDPRRQIRSRRARSRTIPPRRRRTREKLGRSRRSVSRAA